MNNLIPVQLTAAIRVAAEREAFRIPPPDRANALANLIERNKVMIEALDLIRFAVTADADNNDGKIDRKAIQAIVEEALKVTEVAA